jgi:23S rRNA (cytidine1920-2'-O)/16S rRNA (cytidine1409-2'-O)-methyltransferase
LSFISLMMVAPALTALAKPGADLVVLVKPQFEAGRAVVSKGKGVVRDPKVWAGVLCDVAGAFEANGAAVVGGMASPLLGAEGNVEFFLHLCSGAKPSGPDLSELGNPGGGISQLARSMDELALSVTPPAAPSTRGRGRK